MVHVKLKIYITIIICKVLPFSELRNLSADVQKNINVNDDYNHYQKGDVQIID